MKNKNGEWLCKSEVIGSFTGWVWWVSVLELDSWGHCATPGPTGAHDSC